MSNKVAFYLRACHPDTSIEGQLQELRRWATDRGLTEVAIYCDVKASLKTKRPGLDRMLRDARRHRFDILMNCRLIESAAR
ncbi:MAG: hypothetical protein NVS9B15_09880 [Acidobacteriaceae bacterium]